MTHPAPLVDIWRGDLLESQHSGHAVLCDAQGEIIQAWGDPSAIIYPRSSCKMLQALPLVESGAAALANLTPAHLALSCASHEGDPIHTETVQTWLSTLDLDEPNLRCGAHMPYGSATRHAMIRSGEKPCQLHNNCSGKHAGFLTLTKHLGAGPDYNEITHPLQIAIKQSFEELTEETSPTFERDGCSAPNHACSVHGLARAMATYASAHTRSDTRSRAAASLVQSMMAHPDLVAGETRACTELMRAMGGRVAIKTGAEGVYTAILPQQQMGLALKITDGATRGAEAAIAAILVKLGVLEPQNPATLKRLNAPIINSNGFTTGHIRANATLL